MLRTLALSVAALVAPVQAQCGYRQLLPEPGFADSIAYAVSADGSVVVGASTFGFGTVSRRAFRWTEPLGLQPLVTLGGSNSEAHGVSADGTVVVGHADSASLPEQPVLWTAQGSPVDLLASAGITAIGDALDASADGSVVVGYWSTGLAGDGFRWTAATGAVSLNLPSSSFYGRANAVSDDGAVVVGRMGIGGQGRAFRWTAASGAVDIGAPGSGHAEALGVSADGEVVVGWAELGLGAAQAFRWTAATGMVGLGAEFGPNSVLRAASADGTRAVGRSTHPSSSLGAWSAATGPVSLGSWFPRGGEVTDMSENGVVVGIAAYDPFWLRTSAAVWYGSSLGTTYCDAATDNGTGCIGRLDVNGSASVATNSLRLDAYALPTNVLGMFLVARSTATVRFPGGSEGTLCLGGAIGRFNAPGQAQSTGASGTLALALDLTALPSPVGPIGAQAGETWTFQAWHRTAQSSNFSDAVAVTLR